MKLFTHYKYFVFIFFISFITCKKTSLESKTEIFIVGDDGYLNSKVWLDNKQTNMGDSSTNSIARSIYVYDDIVYVAGIEKVGSDFYATIWENGNSTKLSNGSSDLDVWASSLVVNKNGFFVVGNEKGIAKLWKNGSVTNLTDGSSYSHASSVFVKENKVYIVGYEDANGIRIGKLWVNENPTNITDGTYKTRLNSIYVKGEDIYIVGEQIIGNITVATIWKNGIQNI